MIIEIVMSILSNRCGSLQDDPIIFPIRKINSSLLNVVCFIRPKLALFSRPATLFLRGLRFLNQVSILLMWSLFILSFLCSYPVILGKMLTELLVHHSSFSFIRWIQFKLCQLYPFLIANTFSCWCTSYSVISRYSIVPECSRYLEDSCFPLCIHSRSFEVVTHPSHLIQPVQPLF